MWEELTQDVARNWVLALLVVMVVSAVPLVVAPPTSRVLAWLATGSAPVAEPTVIATRAGLQRIGALSGVVVAAVAVFLFIARVDFYLAMVGYAVAAVIGAAAPLGGGQRRRAQLLADDGHARPSTRVWWASTGLGLVTLAVSGWLISTLGRATQHWSGSLEVDAELWMPSTGLRQLAFIAGTSAVLLVSSVAARAAVARRQSMAGADPHADRMVRELCLHRIAYASLAGHTILLGACLPGLRILTLEVTGFSWSVNGDLAPVLSAVGLGLVCAGIVACAASVLAPVWTHPRRRPAAPASAAAPERPADSTAAGYDKPSRG